MYRESQSNDISTGNKHMSVATRNYMEFDVFFIEIQKEEWLMLYKHRLGIPSSQKFTFFPFILLRLLKIQLKYELDLENRHPYSKEYSKTDNSHMCTVNE